MILIYGGTSDSVDLLKKLDDTSEIGYCATTDAGIALVSGFPSVTTFLGKQTAEDMRDLWQSENVSLIIDATHPFAVAVTEQINDVARVLAIPVIRFRRPIKAIEDARVFHSHEQVIKYLKDHKGNVLLTTGSNHAKHYVDALGAERVIARVLPTVDSMEKLDQAGVIPLHRIGQYGPFSQMENEMHMVFSNAKYLVSKNSGKKGLMEEKRLACNKMKVELLVIEPPKEEGDHIYEDMDQLLEAIKTYN